MKLLVTSILFIFFQSISNFAYSEEDDEFFGDRYDSIGRIIFASLAVGTITYIAYKNKGKESSEAEEVFYAKHKVVNKRRFYKNYIVTEKNVKFELMYKF